MIKNWIARVATIIIIIITCINVKICLDKFEDIAVVESTNNIKYFNQKIKYRYTQEDIDNIKNCIQVINCSFVKDSELYKDNIEKCAVSDEVKEYFNNVSKVDSDKVYKSNEINLCSDGIVTVVFGNDSESIYRFTYKDGKLEDVIAYR